MKNTDRLFVILLIFLPLISAIILAIALTQRSNISPDDSSAATPTPTFDIMPVSTTPTTINTPTYETVNPTATATITIKPTATPTPTTKSTIITTPTYEIVNPTATATVTIKSTTIATRAPASSPTATNSPQTPAPTKLDITVTPVNAVPQTTDYAALILTILIVTFTFGGLVAFGSLVRKTKQ